MDPNSALIINEKEAAVVRELFQQQAQQKHVFIYCRVAAEDDARLDEQVTECRTHCETNGFLVIDTFKEFGSGITLDREELAKMRARYGEVDAIVIIDRERLSRRLDLYQTLIAEMQEYHVEIISVNE